MKVILREDIDGLGKSGELVTVKDGFGRRTLGEHSLHERHHSVERGRHAR